MSGFHYFSVNVCQIHCSSARHVQCIYIRFLRRAAFWRLDGSQIESECTTDYTTGLQFSAVRIPAEPRESLCWIRMTRTARQDARRSGKEDGAFNVFRKMPFRILRGTQQ